MNEVQRHSRASSDFTIERILADDHTRKTRVSSLTATVKIYTEGAENFSKSENDVLATIDTENSLSCSRLVGDFSSLPRHGTTGGDNDAFDSIDRMNNSSFHISRTIATSAESSQVARGNRDIRNLKIERSELSWLQCTRYRPPKLLRKTVSGKSGKRRPGAHPRIPFTTSQLQVLEDKYRNTAYLSRRDVIHLSTLLRLPQSRVKIWFQNRRARDRRETGISGSDVTILSGETPAAYTSQDIPCNNPAAPNPV